MPVTTSYPGIYIEELPSSAHTIAAAPTSIAVFVGYVHPFKTPAANFNNAIEVFSFADYERFFGGFFESNLIDNNVPNAVNQFFLNGGSDAYVVGLKPQNYTDNNGRSNSSAATVIHAGVNAENAKFGIAPNQIQFTALEPTDQVPMTITISNVQQNTATLHFDTADIVITYGVKTETLRKVKISDTDHTVLEGSVNGVSSLVTVAPTGPNYPADFPHPGPTSHTLTTTVVGGVGVFELADFTPVFQADSSLDKLPIFNLMVIPGIINNAVLNEALAFCERKMAFLVMDPPSQSTADTGANYIGDYMENTAPKSTNGAIYFPYLKSTDPETGAAIQLPPSGFVTGVYARTDNDRGVWKAPAGLETIVGNTTGVVDLGRMNDARHGKLNLDGVNCLRDFPGIGTVVFGARTLVSANVAFQQWKYVPVRRMALFIEQTLRANLGWVIFEPNDEPLWVSIRTTIENFMLSLFNQGALQGTTPSQAFQVKCDSSTTTQDDINNGIVNIIVAFAPLKPAEFVIIKIAQLAGQAQA